MLRTGKGGASTEGLRHARASAGSAASTINEPKSSTLLALLPPASGVSLDAVEAVQRCIEDSAFHLNAESTRRAGGLIEQGAAVVKEPELGYDASAVDLASRVSELRFPCATKLPFLVIHLKDADRFLRVEIVVLDGATNELRRFELSNRQSVMRISPTSASLPLALNTGWNLLRLDLAAMSRAAWGATYAATTEVTIHGVTRVSKMFFSDALYEDAELPLFLRVIALPLSPAVFAK